MQLKGSFAIAEVKGTEVILCVDSIRSIALYYHVGMGEVIVSDDAMAIAEHIGTERDVTNIDEFKVSSYVTGKESLFDGVLQVLPGEYIIIDLISGDVDRHYWFSLEYGSDAKRIEGNMENEWDGILQDVFSDLIGRLNGRPLLVPLSGGCDSRTIVVTLKRLGYKNVTCLAYGKKDSFEAKISKKVAESLEYKWAYVEYDEDTWNEFFMSDDYLKFLRFSSRGSEIGCMQALPAVLELLRKHVVARDTVVIPGHALDFLAGSHLPKMDEEASWSRDHFVKYIKKRHYSLNRSVDYKGKYRWIEDVPLKLTRPEMIRQYQKWEWINRQAKFIANDVRAYEYAGLDWELPFWDVRCCRFWEAVPYEWLYCRKLQFTYTAKYIDPLAGIKFDYFKSDVLPFKYRVRNFAKDLFPIPLQIISKYRECMHQYRYNVVSAYSHMDEAEFKKCLKIYGMDFNMNTIHVLHYLSRILNVARSEFGE